MRINLSLSEKIKSIFFGKILENKKNIVSILTLLFFSILFDSAFGYSIRPGYVVAIFVLLLLSSRYYFLHWFLVAIFAAMSAFYYPISMMYGSPNINILISLLNTNLNESTEFLKNIPVICFLPSVLIILCSFYILKIRKNIPYIKPLPLIIIFLSIVLFHPVKNYLKIGSVTAHDIRFTPFRVVYLFLDYHKIVVESEIRIKELSIQPSEWSPSQPVTDYDTYIVVIGESVRRDFMHAYGFHLDNTPFISNANGIIFNNYISASGSTQASISGSLVRRSIDGVFEYNNNIIKLAKKQGLYVHWISNQGSFGNDDFGVSLIGKQADSVIFLKKGEYNTQSYPDTDLLPHFENALIDSSEKKLIFLHLMGSHSDFCSRVNHQYDEFFVSEKLSCYVQSIKQTDNLLFELANLANKNGKKWAMIYFSDHGLSNMNKTDKHAVNLQHGDHSKQNYQVPFFITAYDATERKVVSAYRSGLDFLHIYTQWTGSVEPLLSKQCDLLSDTTCYEKIEVINFDHQLISYDSLEDLPLIL